MRGPLKARAERSSHALGYTPCRKKTDHKSISARELFKALPMLRKEWWGGAFWTSNCFAAPAGRFGGCESVKRCVQEQKPENLSLGLDLTPLDQK